MTQQPLWDACVAFHGHTCGGLAIGYQAARYAMELLQLTRAQDEQIVCISENDACGVDAIQVMLGCSVGKGNLLFHLRGKQAFSFYERSKGQSVRLVLRPTPEFPERERKIQYLKCTPPSVLFEVKPTILRLPEPAHLFTSRACSHCGELTAEPMLRWEQGKPVCLDCFHTYSRFDV